MSKKPVIFVSPEQETAQSIFEKLQFFFTTEVQKMSIEQSLEFLENKPESQATGFFILDARSGCLFYLELIRILKTRQRGSVSLLLECSDKPENIMSLLEAGVDYMLPSLKEGESLKDLYHEFQNLDDLSEGILLIPENESDFSSTPSKEPKGAEIIMSSSTVKDFPPEGVSSFEKTAFSSGRTSSVSRVLVVDDDRLTLKILSRLLGKNGFEVVSTQDPLSAPRFLEDQDFDLVLMDFNMPGQSGPETIRRLKQISPGIFVVGMSADYEEDVVNEFLKAGAFTVLKKPFQPKRFMQILKKLQQHKELNSRGGVAERSRGSSKEGAKSILRSVLTVVVLSIFLILFLEFAFKEEERKKQDQDSPVFIQHIENQGQTYETIKGRLIDDLRREVRE